MNEWVKFFLGGGVLLSIVEGIKALISWAIKRKAQKADRAEEKAEKKTEERIAAMEARIQTLEDNDKEILSLTEALVEAQRYVLYDRIRYLGQKYIAEGEVDMEDRRILHLLHAVYHGDETHRGCGGNGDLNLLMQAVDKLPLKMPKKNGMR